MIRRTIQLLLIVCILAFQAKAQLAYRVQINERQVPQIVLKTYEVKYPKVKTLGYFTTHVSYWQYDVSSGWYGDWYGNRTVTVINFEKPFYYEIEFTEEPGEKTRVLYNAYGYWHESRTMIKGFPLAIAESLQKSPYTNWKVSYLKERIESPALPTAVYRFKVSKGMKAKIIRMDENGEIIQERMVD